MKGYERYSHGTYHPAYELSLQAAPCTTIYNSNISGYFFPGCHDENILPPTKMVRPNLTTCFQTNSSEDLENTIVHAFTEASDWVFDLCCGSRELSLAAQKSGRNAGIVKVSYTRVQYWNCIKRIY